MELGRGCRPRADFFLTSPLSRDDAVAVACTSLFPAPAPHARACTRTASPGGGGGTPRASPSTEHRAPSRAAPRYHWVSAAPTALAAPVAPQPQQLHFLSGTPPPRARGAGLFFAPLLFAISPRYKTRTMSIPSDVWGECTTVKCHKNGNKWWGPGSDDKTSTLERSSFKDGTVSFRLHPPRKEVQFLWVQMESEAGPG